jgi:hypothetical protein
MQKTTLAFWIFFFLISFSACSVFDGLTYLDAKTDVIKTKEGFISFQLGGIQDETNSDRTLLFSDISSAEYENLKGNGNNVHWDQNDYDFVMKQVHKYIWNETIDSLKLDDMIFDVNCSDVDVGIQSGSYIFFRTEKSFEDDVEKRIEHAIEIFPKNGKIKWYEKIFSRNLRKNSLLTLSEFQIMADQALLLVEEDGGKLYRLEVNNECNVIISTNYYEGKKVWKVRYYPYRNNSTNGFFREIPIR